MLASFFVVMFGSFLLNSVQVASVVPFSLYRTMSTNGRPYVVERKYRRGDYQSPAITKKRWKFEISNAFFIYFIFSFINAISSLTRKVGK